jgi:hypothetical protein
LECGGYRRFAYGFLFFFRTSPKKRKKAKGKAVVTTALQNRARRFAAAT